MSKSEIGNYIGNKCLLCPRLCASEIGFCGVDRKSTGTVKIARAALHFWEEPCISGDAADLSTEGSPGADLSGSGTVFFSGCPLRCVFCQNKEISHDFFGKEITIEELAKIFLRLQSKGAYNINLVTSVQYTNEVIEAVKTAREQGLSIPIVYNSSGYESVDTIKRLNNIVNIYMPDFKYMDDGLAKKYSGAANYAEIAKAALAQMVIQAPECRFDENGIMQSGVLVRHLVLPSQLLSQSQPQPQPQPHGEDSKKILSYLHETYGDKIYISIMSQYTPFGDLSEFPELQAPLSKAEYDEVVDYAIAIGIENGFLQEGEAAKESFIPPFDLTGVRDKE